MKMDKRILQVAVASALAALGTGAIAGQFTGPTVPSTAAVTYATENFGDATFVAADNIVMPAALFDLVFSTGSGASGGYVISPGGAVYVYFRIDNATFNAAPALGDISVTGINTTGGTPLAATAVALSTDNKTVMVTITNNEAAPAIIGSGSGVTLSLAGKTLNPTAALRTSGGTVAVTGGLSGVTANANVATLPTDIDGAAAYVFLNSMTAINGAVAGNNSVKKIAVDATSQRKVFTAGLGANTVNNLGSVTFTDAAGAQLQVNGADEYTVADPTGRLIDVTVTAASGSFNAAPSSTTGVRLTSLPDCSGSFTGTSSLNAGRTVATITGASIATLPLYVCYSVDGVAQISEVTGITASATLQAPTEAGSANDRTVVASGSLSNVVNDGTVIDLRNYVPVSANAFGYAMLARVINTGATGAAIFAQYLDAATGQPVGSLTQIGTTAAGGVLELTNTQIEAAIGAPAAGANPRLRIVAPTSSLSVQLWMRSNGTWVELTGAQTNGNNPSTNSYDPSRQ